MNQEILEDRLTDTLHALGGIYAIGLILVISSLLFDCIYYYRTHSEYGISIFTIKAKITGTKTKRKPMLSLKDQIVVEIIALFLVLGVMFWHLGSIYNDISNQQYERIFTNYSREEGSTDTSWFSYGHAYIEIDGEKVRVELPYKWTEEEFPQGDFRGIAWYSQKSKILLVFQPET